MKANVHPLDIVFRLAEDHGIVLLNGGGFAAPDWSVRISFANWRIMSTTISVGRCAPSRAGTGGLMRQLQARPPRQPRHERNASSVTSRCCCREYKGKKGE